nr:hypothetical protein BaRGS_030434 [Batillaria attramentaria]
MVVLILADMAEVYFLLLSSEESSDEDSVEEDASDEEEDEEDEMEIDNVQQAGKAKQMVDLATNAEEYFDLHAASVATSDRTLSRLDLPQMDVGVLLSQDFYLILHNIDGAMLRGEKTQTVLIWDQTKASRFRWVWQDLTTYSPYVAETSYENSLLVQQSGGLALRSLAHVMRSLTPNARKIFELLAQYQLDNADSPAPCAGMSFQDLYVRCREAFLVNSDQTLRAQLVEFRDHKLIRAKKASSFVCDWCVILMESSTWRYP